MGVKYKLELWADEAVDQMQFPPDRKIVWRELMDHMEDAWEFHMERGLTNEEAQVEAVRAMGDPVSTGKLLNKAHRPWLGWIWLASKWILIVMAVILVGRALFEEYLWDDEVFYGRHDHCEQNLESQMEHTALETGLVIEDEDYTYVIDHGTWSTSGDSDGYSRVKVVLAVHVKSHGLWQSKPKGFYEVQVGMPAGMPGDNGEILDGVSVRGKSIPLWLAHFTVEYLTYKEELPQWFRITVPGSEFDVTVYSNGEVRREK